MNTEMNTEMNLIWWGAVAPMIIAIGVLLSFSLWLFLHKKKNEGPKVKCFHCGSTVGVKLESSRTQYDWNGSGEDPNRPIPFCRKCAERHHEYWDAMWEEYHHSSGF